MTTTEASNSASAPGGAGALELSAAARTQMLEALFAEQRRTDPGASCCFCGSDADLVEAIARLREAQRQAQRQARLDADRQVDELEEVEP